MKARKAARPANHRKARKPRASVSSAKSRRRKATSTTALTQEHAAAQQHQQLRPRTAEDIANEQTAEQLALRIWAATVGEKVLKDMSVLMDELLQSHLLDDDDEEGDEGWLDEQHKREKKLLDEAIADGLDKYPDIAAVNNLPANSDPDIAGDAKQLKTDLANCAVGATKFKEKFSRTQLGRMVKRDLETRFKKDAKYSQHVRNDVPGSDIKKYGSRGRTSSKGTFVKASDYGAGGWLDALLTGGWLRVAKDRIDPVAWSHQFGLERKTERQNWRHHFRITERSGNQSLFELPREKLTGSSASAIKLLMKAGVHVVAGEAVPKALAQFLRFKPKNEIVRVSRVGWAQVGDRWIFVRPEEVITPSGMSRAGYSSYLLDTTSQHGLHVAGTTAEWVIEIAAPLEGNSNVTLSFGTFFAAPLLKFASEPGGGNHIHGRSTIGKTMASAVGQSIYGWPYETADDAFGASWGGTEAGFDALALAHADLGLPLDEITLAILRTAEQVVYKIASGTKGPRATSAGHLRETAHASVLVFSTGEKPLAQFIGPSLQEGARKRLVDVPAEVQPGSAFETIPHERIHIEGRRLFDAMKRQHGAVGRDWQRYLVELGPDNRIKADVDRHRQAFLALPEVATVIEKAHPQVRAVVNRFALYAAALRMAIEAGLLPWTIENADAGIVGCMRRWVAQRGNVDEAGEIVRAVRQLEFALVAALNDRFIHIHQGSSRKWSPVTEADAIKLRTPNQFDGYLKPDRVLITQEAWARYCNGVDPAEVARHLKQRGTLIVSGNGVSRVEQVIGKTDRFYVLLRASLTPLHPYSGI